MGILRNIFKKFFCAAGLDVLAAFVIIAGTMVVFGATCRADNPTFRPPPHSVKGFIAAIEGPPQVQINALLFWDGLDGWKLLNQADQSKAASVLLKVAQDDSQVPISRARALDILVKLDAREALPIAYSFQSAGSSYLRRSAHAALIKWDAREAAFNSFASIEPDDRIRLIAAAADQGAKINLAMITNVIESSQLRRVPAGVRQQVTALLPKIAKAIPPNERLEFLAYFATFGIVPVDQVADLLTDVPVSVATEWARRDLSYNTRRFYYVAAAVLTLGITDLAEETETRLRRYIEDADFRAAKGQIERYFRKLTDRSTPEAKRFATILEASGWALNVLPPAERSLQLRQLIGSNSDVDWDKAFDAIAARADRADLAFLVEFSAPDKEGSELEQPVKALAPVAASADVTALRNLLSKVLSSDVRVPLINALGRLRAVEATDDILGILSGSDDTDVQAAALAALGEFGTLKDPTVLLQYFKVGTDSDVLDAAVTAAGKTKAAVAIDPLIDLLVQRRGTQRMTTASLANLDVGERATKIVEAILQGCSCNPRDGVQAALPFALRSTDRARVVVRLLRMAQDRDTEARPPIEAMAHLVGGGEIAPEAMIRWLGSRRREESPMTDRFVAIAALRGIEAAWPVVKNGDGEFRRELARKAQEISTAACTGGADHGTPSAFVAFIAKIIGTADSKRDAACWQGDESSVVRKLHTALSETGDHNEAVVLQSHLQTPALENWTANILRWLLGAGGLWVIVWAGLIAAYPWSRSIQSQVFWNDTLRKVAGFGFVDFLLRTIGPLRRLIVRPFQRRLAEAARPDETFAFFDGIRAESEQGLDLGRAIDALPRLKGCLALIGESGLGKTTLLRWLTRQAVSEGRAVAFLDARRCAEGVYPALARLVEGLAKDEAFLRTLIHCGDMAVIIDGLNEVSPDTRTRIIDFAMSHADADVFLSTQPILWDAPLSVPQLVLRPLSEADLSTFLLCFKDFLPADATVAGADYAAAVHEFAEKIRSQANPEVRGHNLMILSNPIDLTLVSELLASGEAPEPSRLDEQIFEKAEQNWLTFNQGAAIPLNEFSEYCFTQRKNDSRRIDDARFNDLARVLAHYRILIPRTESVKDGSGTAERKYYMFRHERLANFIIFHAFTGTRGRERRAAEIGDGRFRSIYLMIADRADKNIAEETLGMLHEHALATKDLTVYADYYRRFAARPDVSTVVIAAKVAA